MITTKIGLYKIRLLGTEEDLDNGFYAIMTSGESSFCLDGEEYIVNDRTIEKLNQENIKFEIKQKLGVSGE